MTDLDVARADAFERRSQLGLALVRDVVLGTGRFGSQAEGRQNYSLVTLPLVLADELLA